MSVLQKKCANSDDLKKHERTHTGEKPYKCLFDGCTADFAQSSGLRRHERTHTGEKPHQCQFCPRGFSDSSNKTKHERTCSLGQKQ